MPLRILQLVFAFHFVAGGELGAGALGTEARSMILPPAGPRGMLASTPSPYRRCGRMERGWVGDYILIVPSAWWVMASTGLVYSLGYRFHWWHDQAPEGHDRKRRPRPRPGGPFGSRPYVSERDACGPAEAPLLFGRMTENGPLYPREPRYNSACTKLPRYRLKQYESFLTMSRNIVANSLNAGKSWVTPMGVKRRDIPGKAEKKQPLSFGCGGGADQVLVFFAWPFVDSPEWNVKLKIASGQERGVKMHCQWPMFRVFKKGNPGHGLPTPPR